MLLTTVLVMAAAILAVPLAASPQPQKVILDTDIGDDVDDAYAVCLLASMPDVKLLGVTTTFGETGKRAEIAAKLLKVLGRTDVPVCAGRAGASKIGAQHAWAEGFRSSAIRAEEAADFLRREIDQNPGQVTLIAIGALTNLGDLLTRYPDVKSKIKQIVIMGGSIYVGYDGGKPSAEWNIKCDPVAARAVFTNGIPLTMAGLEVTAMMQLDADRRKKLFGFGTPATDALAALTYLWGNGTPTLFDPVAVAHATGHIFCQAERLHVEVEDDGSTRIGPGEPNVTVLVRPQKDAFLDWYVQTVGAQTQRR